MLVVSCSIITIFDLSFKVCILHSLSSQRFFQLLDLALRLFQAAGLQPQSNAWTLTVCCDGTMSVMHVCKTIRFSSCKDANVPTDMQASSYQILQGLLRCLLICNHLICIALHHSVRLLSACMRR